MSSFELPWVPDVDEDLVLAEIGRLRQKLDNPDQLEIMARFVGANAPTDQRGPIHAVWLPLSDLALLQPWMIYRRRRPLRLHPGVHRERLRAFKPDYVCDLYDHETGFGEGVVSPLSPHAAIPRRESPIYCVGRQQQRFYIPSAELLRFYFSPLGLLIDDLLLSPTGSDPHDFVRDSGFDGPETFVIKPGPRLRASGSTVHAALLLASPDLQRMYVQLEQSLRYALFREWPAYPLCWLDAPASNLTVQTAQTAVIDAFGVRHDARYVIRLVSDHRPAPFKRLIIDGDEEGPPLEEPGIGGPKAIRPLSRSVLVDSLRRPGARGVISTAQLSTLVGAFPRLEEVRISCTGERRRGIPEHKTAKVLETIELASTAQPGGDKEVARLVTQRLYSPRRERDPTDPLRSVFDDDEIELPTERRVALGDLGFLELFARAAGIVAERGKGGLLGATSPGEIWVWELPTSWGRWAKPRDGFNGRLACICEIRNGLEVAYAMEFDQHHAWDSTSIGVFANAAGYQMSKRSLSVLLRSAVTRKSADRREARFQASPWPTQHDFNDILMTPVVHHPRRRDPSVMADVLIGAAELLTRSELPVSA